MDARGLLPVLALATACGTTGSWPDVPPAAVARAAASAAAPIDHHAEAVRLRRALDAGATDVDTIVWYGRRLAYLGRHDDAIAVFTRGLELHPAEPHLLRHRGHRYLTIRRPDLAIADLELAARAIEGRPDEIEPDGMPNARGIPTSTLHTTVHYHLGLARRLTGHDRGALAAWQRCLAAATTTDMEVAARYWICLTLWRLGQVDGAQAAVAAVASDAEILENHAYHRLCLLFAGRITVEEAMADDGSAPSGTLLYGVACWHRAAGREEEAVAWLRRTVAEGAENAFGRIAAEADLARFAVGS